MGFPFWQFVVVGAVAVLSAMLFATAALWTTMRRAGWMWRIAPVSILLAAFVPVDAYELLVLFACQAGVVIAGVYSVRLRDDLRSATRTGQPAGQTFATIGARQFGARFRFPVRDLLKLLLLVAAVLAIVRLAPFGPRITASLWASPVPWVVAGVALGVITLSAAWVVHGRARWYLRCIVYFFVVGPIAFVVAILEPALGSLVDFTPSVFGMSPGQEVNSETIIVLSITMTPWLALLRAAGLGRLDRRKYADIEGARIKGQLQGDHALRRIALVVAGVVALVSGCALGDLYWTLLPPVVPEADLPSPNGYDEIVLAGQGLNWNAIPQQDVDEATLDACRVLVKVNSAPLARARHALTIPSRNPVVFDVTFFSTGTLTGVQMFRDVSRVLRAEARSALADGRQLDAMNSHVDILRLASMLANGGLWVDDLVADALIGVGIAGLVSQLPHFNAMELGLLAKPLDELQNAREPIESIQHREELWQRLSCGWAGRLWTWAEVLVSGDTANSIAFADARRRSDALLRLVLAEAAVRRYALEKGSPPESLTSLVPDFLSEVPEDPYSNKALVYRRTDEGYLLYSVGGNCKDDGGQRATCFEATTARKGDLFFDASQETPEDATPQEASPQE